MSALPINEDHGDVPRHPAGVMPDPEPRFGPLIAAAWHEQYRADEGEGRATVNGSLLRASDAGACARALGYRVQRRMAERHNAQDGNEQSQLVIIPPSNPPSMADEWRMGIGQMIHKVVEQFLPTAFPGAECEVELTWDDIDLSAHVDVIVTTITPKGKPYKVVIEVKTINGFGFKAATIGARVGSNPEGPRHNAVVQGALAAERVDADELVIMYLSLELIGVDIAAKRNLGEIGRFVAEWTYPKAEYLPLAEAERKRMEAVLHLVDEDVLPPRAIPGLPTGARIIDPTRGTYDVISEGTVFDTGLKTWHCGYCWERDRCVADGPT